MKRFLFGVAVFVLSAVCTAESQNQPPQQWQTESAASITPAEIKLGYVVSTSVHDLVLTICNTTQQEIPIDAVVIDCDCITVKDAPKKIPAESSLPIRLRFTAPETTGPYTKTITVTSGSENHKTRFTARINAPLRIEPKELVFSDLSKNAEIKFTIHNDGTEPVRLLYATAVPALCSVKTPAYPLLPKSHITLTVILNEPAPDRRIVLNIRTNHPFQKTVSIPVRISKKL